MINLIQRISMWRALLITMALIASGGLEISAANAYTEICEREKVMSPNAPDANAVSIICEEELGELPQLDRALDGYYRAAMERTKNRKQLVREQRNWLKQRNACDTRQCVGRAYHRRIFDLAVVPAQAAIHSFKSGIAKGRLAFILTREMGLKNFDGGKSDYDAVSVDWGNELDLSQPCKNRYDFIGSGITAYAPCKGAEYGVIKPVTTFDGKQFQLLIAHEISTQASGAAFEGVPEDYLLRDKQMSIANLPDGSQVFFEDSPSRIFHSVSGQPAHYDPLMVQLVRIDDSGGTTQQWHIVVRVKIEGRDEFSMGVNGQVLANGMLLVHSRLVFLFDPVRGVSSDSENVRTFTTEQVLRWKKEWSRDYVAQHPECADDIKQCPDKLAATDYLWKRFHEEMTRQFAITAQ